MVYPGLFRNPGLRSRPVRKPIAFRAFGYTGVTSANVPKPAGLVVGDAVFIALGSSTASLTVTSSIGGAVWTKDNIVWAAHGYTTGVYRRIVDANDIDPACNWVINSSVHAALSAAWEAGVGSTIHLRSQQANPTGQASITLPGYSPIGKGSITIVQDRDVGSPINPPAGWTERADSLVTSFWKTSICDNVAYAGGDAVFTGMSSNFGEVGWHYEVV